MNKEMYDKVVDESTTSVNGEELISRREYIRRKGIFGLILSLALFFGFKKSAKAGISDNASTKDISDDVIRTSTAVKTTDVFTSGQSAKALADAVNGLSKTQNDNYTSLQKSFSDALAALKNTAVAKAISAAGTTFTAVIAELSAIKDKSGTTTTATGAIESNKLNVKIPENGYYNTAAKLAVDVGTATRAQVLKDKTFTSTAGLKTTGTMADNTGKAVTATTGEKDGDYLALTIPATAYYTTTSKVKYALSSLGGAIAAQVLKDKTFTSSAGVKVSGTMTDNTGKAVTATTGEKDGNYLALTIPATAYYTKTSKVKYALSSLGGATAAQVLKDKTFTSSAGVKVSGTMTDNGAKTQTLKCGESFTIPAGFHNGSGKITADTLESQTGVDSGKTAAAAAQILTGYQAWVNGNKVAGTMANQGKKTATLSTTTKSFTIPAGYHDGTGSVSITLEEAEVTATVAGITVVPETGKVLSKVKVNPQVHSDTYTTTTSEKKDLGENHKYRYVDTTGMISTPTATYTLTDPTTTGVDVTNYAKVVTSGLVKPSGTLPITSNGNNIDVSGYQYVNVNVSGASSLSLVNQNAGSAFNNWASNVINGGTYILVYEHAGNKSDASVTCYGGTILTRLQPNARGICLVKASSTTLTFISSYNFYAVILAQVNQ